MLSLRIMPKGIQPKTTNLLSRAVSKTVDRHHLARALASRKKLRVKLGIDPTAPDLHLGHAVLLRKLRAFQDAGHTVVLIFGDFTAMVGDPSERSAARPALSARQVRENVATYKAQAAKVLDIRAVEIRFNREWFGKKKFDFFLELGSKFGIKELLEREEFKQRLLKGRGVSLAETIYPLLQGYDSVVVKADVELGGIDQTLNLLFGREMQRKYNQPPQDILTVPYLIGLDGTHKMSKSEGNTIRLGATPDEMFGKLMSIRDELLRQYYELLTDEPVPTVTKRNAKQLKLRLAHKVVSWLHSSKKAKAAQEAFERTFSKKEPVLAKSVRLRKGIWRLDELLVALKAVDSKGAAQRLIQQGGLEIDGKKQTDWTVSFTLRSACMVRAGKHRFYKLLPS